MKKYHVVSFGAATVDINIEVGHDILERHSLKKGLANPVDAEKIKEIASGYGDVTKTSGGPGVNVATGIALHGGASALIAKVANDEHGLFFIDRVQSNGVDYMPLLCESVGTTCLAAMTTPDKERTFAFIDGAGQRLTPEDVDTSLLMQAEIVYFDSYLWLSEGGRETVHHGAREAKKSGGKVALALNDKDLVASRRKEFFALAVSHADILVGDRHEFMALLGTETLEETIDAVIALGLTASITAGASGAYVVENGKSAHVPARKIENIVDTCGAGDQFAAGFLYGLSQGKSAEESAHIGTEWASDVIQHKGAEPKIGKKPSTPTAGPRI